jgi:hypothetical protein
VTRRRAPWFVWAAFGLAFLGGLGTVAVVGVILVIVILVRSAVWWSEGPPRRT